MIHWIKRRTAAHSSIQRSATLGISRRNLVLKIPSFTTPGPDREDKGGGMGIVAARPEGVGWVSPRGALLFRVTFLV